jgi:hypothetical protein
MVIFYTMLIDRFYNLGEGGSRFQFMETLWKENESKIWSA